MPRHGKDRSRARTIISNAIGIKTVLRHHYGGGHVLGGARHGKRSGQ